MLRIWNAYLEYYRLLMHPPALAREYSTAYKHFKEVLIEELKPLLELDAKNAEGPPVENPVEQTDTQLRPRPQSRETEMVQQSADPRAPENAGSSRAKPAKKKVFKYTLNTKKWHRGHLMEFVFSQFGTPAYLTTEVDNDEETSSSSLFFFFFFSFVYLFIFGFLKNLLLNC